MRDYRDAAGNAGNHARWLYAYGREGKACLTCGATITRVVFSNRSAFFCPGCQPDPRRPGA
jgi:formamidopyrimidine-DNA glycosylase